MEISTLTARDKENKRVDLEYLKPNEAKKMLGVQLAPDGNNTVQVQEMENKTKKLAESIRTGYLQKHEAWTALTLMAMKSIEYPLPALTLKEEECDRIMRPLLKAYLPKAGVVRTFKRDLVYATLKKQGLGLKNPYLTQGIAHVIDCVEHIWKQTITGHFINIALENIRLELGVNITILCSEYKTFEPLIMTESWTQSCWKFMSETKITFDDKTAKINMTRDKDRTIMDGILELKLHPQEVKQVNKCRLYLKVATLSDITTGDGKMTTRDAWMVRVSQQQMRTQYTGPN